MRLSSDFRANLDSSVNITLLQSDTVQLTCFRNHFNHASLDWTDRKIQTRGIRGYIPLICNLQRIVAADVALPMDHITIDVARVEVVLPFHLSKIVKYRSSEEIVTLVRPATGLRTTVYEVWDCFHKSEITE